MVLLPGRLLFWVWKRLLTFVQNTVSILQQWEFIHDHRWLTNKIEGQGSLKPCTTVIV